MIPFIFQNPEITKNIAEQSSYFSTEYLALVVAFLAVFFGPIVQYLIARKQINSRVLSGNRQEWINTLRESIAQFKANFTLYAAHLSMKSGEHDPQTVNELGLQSNLYSEKIKLLINPKEDDHNELVSEIDNLIDGINIFTTNNEEAKNQKRESINEGLDNITSISQTILKREWERVKKLK